MDAKRERDSERFALDGGGQWDVVATGSDVR